MSALGDAVDNLLELLYAIALEVELDLVEAAVARIEPATVMEVLAELEQPWERRGTVRNRLNLLVGLGRLIDDEGRPVRYALNGLGPANPVRVHP